MLPMRTSLTPPLAIAGPGRPRVPRRPASARACCVVALCALSLAGCAPVYGDYSEIATDGPRSGPRRQAAKKSARASIPLPNQTLLAVPAKPDCEAGGQQLASTAAVPPSPPSEKNADLALRIKLEYERECYRQAEIRVREQLRKLQASASDTVRAVKQLEHDPR